MAETLPNEAGPDSPSAREPRRKRHRYRWIWMLVVLVLLVCGLVVWLHRPKRKPLAPPAIAISTTGVERGEIPVTVTALGSVVPVYTVGISPRVDGRIIKVDYTEGQMVKTNDPLATIDPEPFKAMVTESEGQLARDKAQLESARIDLKRYQEALIRRAVPEQQVADQSALVRQLEGTVKLDEGTLANAKVQLAYCDIRAPISGRVGLRLIDPGNVVHAANTNALVVIAQLQPITVIFSVAEDYLPEIQRQAHAGHPMVVEAYDRVFANKIANGAFLTTDNIIDAATGTIRIRAIFTNEDLTLFPNQFVNARLVIENLRDQALIPTFAIQRNPQGAFVYVVTNHEGSEIVTMRNIKVGVGNTNSSSVQGLQPGEMIAMDNFNKLGEGVKVSTRQPTGASRGTNAPAASLPKGNTNRASAPSK